nr:MAG TPA: hypothetical protein [Caudoviricetes sp.]
MILDTVKINGKDILSTWNAFMLESSYNSLLTPVNPKSNIENKNRNEHGKRVLIGNIRLDESTIQLLFHIQGTSISDYLQKKKAFENELRSGWILFAVQSLRTAYKLCSPEFLDLSTGIGIREGTISVRFTEPNPNERKELDENGNLLTHFAKTFPNTFD